MLSLLFFHVLQSNVWQIKAVSLLFEPKNIFAEVHVHGPGHVDHNKPTPTSGPPGRNKKLASKKVHLCSLSLQKTTFIQNYGLLLLLLRFLLRSFSSFFPRMLSIQRVKKSLIFVSSFSFFSVSALVLASSSSGEDSLGSAFSMLDTYDMDNRIFGHCLLFIFF